jgi:hypothetical protein
MVILKLWLCKGESAFETSRPRTSSKTVIWAGDMSNLAARYGKMKGTLRKNAEASDYRGIS